METGRLSWVRRLGGLWRLTGKIRAPALVAPLTEVSRLPLKEGCEGKVMFSSHSVLSITAPRGLSTSKNIRSTSWMSVCVGGGRCYIVDKGRCWWKPALTWAVEPQAGFDNKTDLQKTPKQNLSWRKYTESYFNPFFLLSRAKQEENRHP